jgi:hypothetical protein
MKRSGTCAGGIQRPYVFGSSKARMTSGQRILDPATL